MTGLIFASSRVTPRLVARVGARPILLTGLASLTLAALWISRATPSGGYFFSLLGPLMLFGIGAGCCFLPLSVTILAGVPRGDAGAASGMLQTMQQSGAALGVAALTSIAASHGRGDALLAGAAIASMALLLAFFAIRRPERALASTPEEEAEEILPLVMSE
jgi:MFS family permease